MKTNPTVDLHRLTAEQETKLRKIRISQMSVAVLFAMPAFFVALLAAIDSISGYFVFFDREYFGVWNYGIYALFFAIVTFFVIASKFERFLRKTEFFGNDGSPEKFPFIAIILGVLSIILGIAISVAGQFSHISSLLTLFCLGNVLVCVSEFRVQALLRTWNIGTILLHDNGKWTIHTQVMQLLFITCATATMILSFALALVHTASGAEAGIEKLRAKNNNIYRIQTDGTECINDEKIFIQLSRYARTVEEIKFHDFTGTQIDLAALAKYENLRTFELTAENLHAIDLSALSECRKLENISIVANGIQQLDLSPLSACKELITINITSRKITTFKTEKFNAARTLEKIKLRINVSELNLNFLANATKLDELLIFSPPLESLDLTPLNGKQALTSLEIVGRLTAIDLTPLANCIALRKIDFSGNAMSELDLTPLVELERLNKIDFARCAIVSAKVDGFAGRKPLHLNFAANPLDENTCAELCRIATTGTAITSTCDCAAITEKMQKASERKAKPATSSRKRKR